MKQFTLHNVAGPYPISWRLRQRRRFPKEGFQPQDYNIETLLDVNPKLPIYPSLPPFPFGNYKFGIDIYTLLYLKQITNRDLQYSTGNSAQYSVITKTGKEFEKEWIDAYV